MESLASKMDKLGANVYVKKQKKNNNAVPIKLNEQSFSDLKKVFKNKPEKLTVKLL